VAVIAAHHPSNSSAKSIYNIFGIFVFFFFFFCFVFIFFFFFRFDNNCGRPDYFLIKLNKKKKKFFKKKTY